ncbi:hypothetical protein ONZ45_g16794 [Pleurotus djamor]|nr:hypothetical protein ONZ45_g16794 [Pleurotus djamor]
MDATDRARVSKLDQPLKAYASKAASGTYQGIKQLNNYVAKHRLIWPDPLHVAPVTLAGLPREIPTFSNNVEIEESNVVQCAALSLSSLAYLAEMSKDPTPMADFFVRHQRTIFPWLSFIQRTFFDPGIDALKTPKRASEEISDPAILQLIADTSNFLDRTVQVYDLADHDLITSFVLDLWQSFLGMPLDVVQGSLPTVAGHVGNVVTALIHASAMDRKRCIVKKYGGPAVMARLYLSFVEQDLARVKLGEAEYGFSYLMLEQTLTMALTNLANDIFLGDPEGVMPEVFPRLTAAVIWLINNYDRVVAKKTSKVEVLFGLPTIIAAYCQFIITYPPTPTFNPILVAFKQGFCKRLRSHLPKDGYRASDKMSNSPLREFLHRLGLASSMCPGILRQTKCLISMPTNPVHESYWKAFDDFAAPSGRLLDALYLSVSGNPQMCSVVRVLSSGLRC